MTLTGDAADAGRPESGEQAHFRESGPGPVIWVTTSQLLGLVASPQLAPLCREDGSSPEGEAEPVPPPPPAQGEQDVGEAVTSYPSPLSL